MKINKITLCICILLAILSGSAMIMVEYMVPDSIDVSLCQSIISGFFTSFIVSVVISLIGYFHERSIILEKIDNEIKNIYITMMMLSKCIGDILPQINEATDMESLPFKHISRWSQLCVEHSEKMDLGLFSPICKWGKLAQIHAKLIEFQQALHCIKSNSMSLQLKTMEFTEETLKRKIAYMQGEPPNSAEDKSINALKNLINIKTAKLHQYVADQTLELDKIAKSFYDYKDCKQSWKEIKASLTVEAENVIKE